MATIIIALIILGLYMVALPDAGFNLQKITLILWHKEIGMIALALAALRLMWRLGNIVPRLSPQTPGWQKIAARVVHLSFYGFMFALPISGWLMSLAGGFPVTLFRIIPLPNLIQPNINELQMYIAIHKWLAYGLMLTIGLHISAALFHHFVYKDDTLRRMLS
jgi:cytochrome b561